MRGGYTLVELILVVAVLGISGTLLLPNLVDRGTFAIQAASRAIVSDLVFAQSDALANQGFRRVQFIESEAAGGGYVGYCIVRVTPETFYLPFDTGTADFVSDPMANGDEQGRFLVDFSQDGRFGDVRIDRVSIASDCPCCLACFPKVAGAFKFCVKLSLAANPSAFASSLSPSSPSSSLTSAQFVRDFFFARGACCCCCI